ncbi:Uronate isomerase, partial [termite gut metagenome]
MKNFMDENFLLQTETARKLYHEHAAKLPIIVAITSLADGLRLYKIVFVNLPAVFRRSNNLAIALAVLNSPMESNPVSGPINLN